MGDLLMSQNGPGAQSPDQLLVQRSFTCITPTSAAIWLTGQSVLQYQVGSTGLTGLGSGGKIFRDAGLLNAVASVMNPTAPPNLLAQAQQELVDRAEPGTTTAGALHRRVMEADARGPQAPAEPAAAASAASRRA